MFALCVERASRPTGKPCWSPAHDALSITVHDAFPPFPTQKKGVNYVASQETPETKEQLEKEAFDQWSEFSRSLVQAFNAAKAIQVSMLRGEQWFTFAYLVPRQTAEEYLTRLRTETKFSNKNDLRPVWAQMIFADEVKVSAPVQAQLSRSFVAIGPALSQWSACPPS